MSRTAQDSVPLRGHHHAQLTDHPHILRLLPWLSAQQFAHRTNAQPHWLQAHTYPLADRDGRRLVVLHSLCFLRGVCRRSWYCSKWRLRAVWLFRISHGVISYGHSCGHAPGSHQSIYRSLSVAWHKCGTANELHLCRQLIWHDHSPSLCHWYHVRGSASRQRHRIAAHPTLHTHDALYCRHHNDHTPTCPPRHRGHTFFVG